MIVGTKEFIEKARRNRKMFGGTMKQVGISVVCFEEFGWKSWRKLEDG